MKSVRTVAVIGGNGRTGKYVVSELLKAGYFIKLLLRNPNQAESFQNESIQIVTGDVIDENVVLELLSGCDEVISFDKKGEETNAAAEWMKSHFPEIQEDRQKSYTILEKSDLDWTIIRVPFIEFNGVKTETKVSEKDCLGSRIDASSIAEFMVNQLSDTTYCRKAPFIASA